MTDARAGVVWGLALALVAAAIVRVASTPDPYRVGAPIVIEDRREHRFRNATWSEAEALLQRIAREVETATDAQTRARALARIASLQQERGYSAQADYAAREALRLAPTDPTVRQLLNTPVPWPDHSGR